MKDPRGNVTTYTYDENNRLTSETNPEDGAVSYEYNENHKLTKRTNEKRMILPNKCPSQQ